MDLPATDPFLSPQLDPVLGMMASRLLTLAAVPWSFEDMRACWHVSTEVADQFEAALLDRGVIALGGDGRYKMPGAVRDCLLIRLMNAGALEEAYEILIRWRTDAAQAGDLLTMAASHEHLSNLLMLTGHEEGAIAEDQCALALRQSAGDTAGVARLSWSIGAYYARTGERRRALPLLTRAVALAEKLGMEQAPRYRARLREVQLAEEPPRG